ncbi:MAG: hypothetical protein JJU29_22580 [Verrucomicrobia bacterium]|nr:hypothetical protein [Verrucomicrobiota bacterium]
MKTTITSTKLVRQLGDCLARVKYRGEAFVITKNDEAIAELLPTGISQYGKWSDIATSLTALPLDEDFADDLERVNQLSSRT